MNKDNMHYWTYFSYRAVSVYLDIRSPKLNPKRIVIQCFINLKLSWLFRHLYLTSKINHPSLNFPGNSRAG
jgi:hypothetical protein